MKNPAALRVQPLTTRIFRQGESLLDFIVEQTPREFIAEQMVIAVTSKIVSLAENRVVDRAGVTKNQLVEQEADRNLGLVAFGCYLTIKHGILIPSAGIDESNAQNGGYILYPGDPFASMKSLWDDLRKRWALHEIGVVMTDSHLTPLRRGVTGISLAHWGFKGLKDLIGDNDLFGRKMQMTTVNVADGLAAAATLMMGEAGESRPLAILRSDDLVFTESVDPHELKMPLEDDLFYPLLRR